MPTVSTKYRSVSGDQSSRTIGYIVKNATSDIDALDALEIAAPATYDGLVRTGIQIDEVIWPSIFEGTVTYGKKESKDPPASGSVEFAFDVGLENVTVKQSLSTVATYQAGTALNFNKAIDVERTSGDSFTVHGVSVGRPISSFTLSYYPTWAIVTDAWKRSVMNLAGKVNSTSYFGYNAGEVRFVGCTGKARNGTDWELSFRFDVRLNRTGITIGAFSGIAVDGWDVLWVYNEETIASGRYVPTPYQVNVERVFERDNFQTVLGIP